MPIHKVLYSQPQRVPVKIWASDEDAAADQQLINLATLPFIHHHVAAMADRHLGIGATIGSVIATNRAIVPAAVGVDIGCGMNAVRLSLKADQLPDNLNTIYDAINKAIPLGPGGEHKQPITAENHALWERLYFIKDKHPTIHPNPVTKAAHQAGTLGSGNHFIELCLDENNYVWIMLHSGSRGIGNCIGRYFIEQAKEEMLHWHIELADKDLAYLPEGSPLYDDYCEAAQWAQDYALENRRLMMASVLSILHQHIPLLSHVTDEAINCHHNYIAKENHFGANVWITRKGAIRAREGDLGIIPGSMGTKSFIVRGKGNPDSFCSCSHGAGRRMSRSAATKQYTTTDLAEQTKGIICRKDADVIDEIPSAYKNIDTVMNNQTDLVEIVHTLKQILNVKG